MFSRKKLIDDTQPLSCSFDSAENIHGHTVYTIKVQRGQSDSTWAIERRYSEFDTLNNQLACSGIEIPFPPKKLFGNLDREFVAERQQALQVYINFVLNHPLLSASLHVKKFLDPANYSFNLIDNSLQHVSMFFRSEPQWEVMEPIVDLGWRIRKQYFNIKNKNDLKKKYLLSWLSSGVDRHLSEKDLSTIMKLFGSLQHPFIYPLTLSCVSSDTSLVIYEFQENGTMRDILCKTKPNVPFLKKYGNPKLYTVFELSRIQTFGANILQALKFLHDKGLFHGSVHSGNIVIIEGKCKLLDVFNGVIGAPSFLRPYLTQIKRIQSVENIDVYCFGHLLYEMTFGMPLYSVYCDNIPNSCAPELRSVLLSILSKDSLKNGVPSLSTLLQHPFFSSAVINHEKVHFKVPSQTKESLRKAKEEIESRLKEEQRAIRHTKRLTKVHAQLSYEDEKKRRGHEKKKKSEFKNSLDITKNGSSGRSHASTPTGALTPSGLSTPTFPTPPLPTSKSMPSFSVAATTDPPMAPPPPPPPPLTPTISHSSGGNDRTALLNSIQGFSKMALKKTETKDCSSPKI